MLSNYNFLLLNFALFSRKRSVCVYLCRCAHLHWPPSMIHPHIFIQWRYKRASIFIELKQNTPRQRYKHVASWSLDYVHIIIVWMKRRKKKKSLLKLASNSLHDIVNVLSDEKLRNISERKGDTIATKVALGRAQRKRNCKRRSFQHWWPIHIHNYYVRLFYLWLLHYRKCSKISSSMNL